MLVSFPAMLVSYAEFPVFQRFPGVMADLQRVPEYTTFNYFRILKFWIENKIIQNIPTIRRVHFPWKNVIDSLLPAERLSTLIYQFVICWFLRLLVFER